MTRREQVRRWVTGLSEFASKHQPDKMDDTWASYVKKLFQKPTANLAGRMVSRVSQIA